MAVVDPHTVSHSINVAFHDTLFYFLVFGFSYILKLIWRPFAFEVYVIARILAKVVVLIIAWLEDHGGKHKVVPQYIDNMILRLTVLKSKIKQDRIEVG